MKIAIRIIAGLAIPVILYGIFQEAAMSVKVESAIHQIYFSVETIKFALVPYCIVKLLKEVLS